MLLNALQMLPTETITALVGAGRVYFEIATLEGVGGIAALLNRVPLDGSCSDRISRSSSWSPLC